MSALSLPVDFGRYHLVERIAIGGMAELYRATVGGQHDFQRVVVIKRILSHLAENDEFVQMFINEAKLTAQLAHPKIVEVFELGMMNGEPFIAMELIDGLDVLSILRNYARRRKRLPVPIGVHILHEVLDALLYAHEAVGDSGEPLGIVHRDISPGNILVSRSGAVKLTDFGIARAADNQGRTDTGTLKGKYSYMSPEQVVQEPIDGRSDLFACGVVLAEVLMTRRLFVAANDLDVLLMVRDVRLDRLYKYGADLPPGVRAIIERSMRRNPDDRYQSAREFRDALADWLFQERLRIGPADVAEVVEEIFEERRQRELLDASFEEETLTGEETRRTQERYRSSAPARNVPAPEAVPEPIDAEERSAGYAAVTIDGGDAPGGEPPAGEPEPAPMPDPASVHDDPDRDGTAPAPRAGDFTAVAPLRLLYELAVTRATGLLEVEFGSISKRAYLVEGVPQLVESNVASERLGEFLVASGTVSPGELAMALAVMPQFGGQLGETLIGLGLTDPLGVVRALSESVRAKMVDVCTWQKGQFRWSPDRRSEASRDPVRVDPFDVIGAAAMRIDADFVADWAKKRSDDTVHALANEKVRLEDFRLGARPHDVHRLLDGKSLGELTRTFHDPGQRLEVLRVVHLLAHTDFLKFT